MRCETCEHMKRIRAALAPCQTCDCGSHHGASHVQATDYTLSQRIRRCGGEGVRTDDDREQNAPAPVTPLPEDVEDRVRGFLVALFALDPLDLMRVQHAFRTQNGRGFGAVLDGIAERIGSYRADDRYRAFHARKRIMSAVPELAALIASRRPSQDARKRHQEREDAKVTDLSSKTRGRKDGRKAGRT